MRLPLLLMLMELVALVPAAPAAFTTNNFSGAADQTPYLVKAWHSGSPNLLLNGALRLTSGLDQIVLVAFDRTAEGACRRITAQWDLSCTTGADGFSFNLLNTAFYGTNGLGPFLALAEPPGPMEEPVFTNSLSVAFDVYDADDYQNLGAREVSLHWNGQERANRRCPVEFRTGSFLPVRAEFEFVAGGAEVSVWINNAAVYTNYFLAGVVPYEARVALAARTGGLSFVCRVDNLSVDFVEPGLSFPEPLVVRTFDREWVNITNRAPQRFFALPSTGRTYGRIVVALTLSAPPNGFDSWDRQMSLSVVDQGQRFEIARFITPYGRGYTWYADVTDYQTLLRGDRVLRAFIDTWVSPDAHEGAGSGWLVTADLLYYEGWPELEAFKVENLWNGEPNYGDTNNPIASFFSPRQPTVDPAAERVKLRFMVTGHGQSPNTGNAAEFLVRGRTVTVNGTSFYNVLWKDDCYLNPCRPQAGNWRYARAGWAPGDRVAPWELEVGALVTPGQPATIQYVADPYTNNNIVSGNAARHWVESQLISYRRPSPPSISIQRLGGSAVLRWPTGGLQSSGDAAGPYEDVVGAAPPWTNNMAEPRRFFRLRR